MKICLLIEDLGGGGAERVAVGLGENLAQRGHSVAVVAWKENPNPILHPQNGEIDSLQIMTLGGGFLSLVKFLRGNQFDAVLAFMPKMIFLGWVSLTRTPSVLVGRECTFESSIFTPESSYWHSAKGRALRLGALLAYRRCNGLIFCSEGFLQEIRKRRFKLPEFSIAIPNPLTPSIKSQALERRDSMHKKERYKASPLRLLLISRLVSSKGVDVAIRAVKSLDEHLAIHLTVLGDGPSRSALENLAFNLGVSSKVSFMGFVRDPSPFLLEADVLLHTPSSEGFGNVLVEALAYGLPVVASDCQYGPQEILQGLPSARLVPVGDISAITEAVIDIASRLGTAEGDEFSELSVQRSERYNSDKIYDSYEDFILSIINASRVA